MRGRRETTIFDLLDSRLEKVSKIQAEADILVTCLITQMWNYLNNNLDEELDKYMKHAFQRIRYHADNVARSQTYHMTKNEIRVKTKIAGVLILLICITFNCNAQSVVFNDIVQATYQPYQRTDPPTFQNALVDAFFELNLIQSCIDLFKNEGVTFDATVPVFKLPGFQGTGNVNILTTIIQNVKLPPESPASKILVKVRNLNDNTANMVLAKYKITFE